MDKETNQSVFGMPLHDEYMASLRDYKLITTIDKMTELAKAELEKRKNNNK